jgi:hypothetical protein
MRASVVSWLIIVKRTQPSWGSLSRLRTRFRAGPAGYKPAAGRIARPTMMVISYSRQNIRTWTRGGSRGTRADQGVRPTV